MWARTERSPQQNGRNRALVPAKKMLDLVYGAGMLRDMGPGEIQFGKSLHARWGRQKEEVMRGRGRMAPGSDAIMTWGKIQAKLHAEAR